MVDSSDSSADSVTIYCTRCGGAMRVAPEHVAHTVGCPHCGGNVEPWRVVKPASPDTSPDPPRPAQPAQPALRPGPTQAGLPGDYRNRRYRGPYSSRNKVVAGVLGILLGAFGVHRFYLGYIGIGILQLSLFFCTGGFSAIWGFIEGILCLTGQMRDVDGLPLGD
ncbi:MAG: TM2 domain-containing protein [Phycisphaerae bacterium]